MSTPGRTTTREDSQAPAHSEDVGRRHRPRHVGAMTQDGDVVGPTEVARQRGQFRGEARHHLLARDDQAHVGILEPHRGDGADQIALALGREQARP
jgi:hypothetical protein